MEKAISAGGIIFRGDRIIFVVYPDGKLTFPKGTVERGETLGQTALREVEEETGLRDLKIEKKLGIVTRPAIKDNGEKVIKDIHLYLMKVNDYTQLESDEKTTWLTVNEALPRLFPEEAHFLRSVSKQLQK